MSKRAEVLVRGLIRNDAGLILLVRHISRDWWFFPGGHLERGESMAECLQRELREEGELEVRPTGLQAVVEHRYQEDGEYRVEVNMLLRAKTSGRIGTVEEKLEFRWVTVEQLQEADVLPERLKAAALDPDQSAVGVVVEGLADDAAGGAVLAKP